MDKKEKAINIINTLRDNGYQSYFAGGMVRDMVMGNQGHDYDIVTDASVLEIQRLFPHTVPVGAQFGIILVIIDGETFDVSTFRGKDKQEDVMMRDFTINGLLFDPVDDKLIDFVGAQEDIKDKIIRTIGEPAKRFEEDPLRVLRAIRFAANLGFSIEDSTYNAIKNMTKTINKASPERVRDELIKLMTGPKPGPGLTLLDESGLLIEILPEIVNMKGVRQPEEFHPEGDVFIHTRLMMDYLKNSSITLAFGCLFHDIGKPLTFEIKDRIRFNNHNVIGARMVGEIMSRLKFPNEDIDRVSACVENHMDFINAFQMKKSTLKRLLMRETFKDEIELHRIDCLVSHRDLRIYEFMKNEYNEYLKQPLKPKPLLRGDDLLGMGFSQGPIIGRILREVEDGQLEDNLKTKEEAVEWVRQRKWDMGG